MSDTPPDVEIRPRPRRWTERLSPVWLIPLLALAVALGVALKNWTGRGPEIQITFDAASGIREGETELRYRDVAVGVVERIGFSSELAKVLVTVRLDADIAEYVDESATFWVVQPEVTTRGVRGLGTVLSGVYIEGVWDTVPDGLHYRHESQTSRPLLRAGEAGLTINLRATEGVPLVEGTPILFKGIEVGQVGEPQLSAGGAAAFSTAVIRAPYAGLIRSTTRFWDTSGFRFRIGGQGAELDFSSLATLISGGIAFETVASGGVSAQADTTFALYPDEQTARASFFSEGAGPQVNLTVVFQQNVAGLATGSPVTYGGVVIGEVVNLTGMVDAERFGDTRVRLLATISVRPGRLGIEGGQDEALDFLEERVAEGLRAQLQTSSILTGGLKIELLQVPGAEPAQLDRSAQPFPRIPATDSDISDVSATAQGVFERVNALPIEELIQAAIGFLDNATTLVANGDLSRVPGEAIGLLADMRGIVGSDGVQAIPGEVAALMAELRGATGDLRAIVTDLRENDATGRVLAAVGAAQAAADAVTAALEGAPDLVSSLTETADAARSLPLEPLILRLTELATAAEAVAGSEATRAIPGDVRALIGDARGLVTELEGIAAGLTEAEAVGRVLAAIDAAAAAGRAVETGAEGIPALVERATAVAAVAEDLPLDALVAEVTDLARSAGQLAGSEDAQALPADLRAFLDRLGAVADDAGALTGDLVAAGTVDRLLAAVDAATEAARGVSAGADGVPQLVARLDAVAARAESVPIDTLAAELEQLLGAARSLVDQDSTRALPASLNGALGEVEAALAELREGGTVENANATLSAARQAADAIEQAARRLPALVDRVDGVLVGAGGAIAGFGEDSQFTRGVRQALREVERAAEAVQSLARSLERRPNSLILGR